MGVGVGAASCLMAEGRQKNRRTQYVGHSKKERTKAPQATYTGMQRGATRAAHRVQTQSACTGDTERKTQLHRREHTPGGTPGTSYCLVDDV
jgi:hypothetical protein